MMLGDFNSTLKAFLSRGIIIMGLSYVLEPKELSPGLMAHAMNGGIGSLGSIVSQCYVEPMLNMTS